MTDSVKTYRARTMREALEKMKRDLGDDAVILGTRTVSAGGIGGLVGGQHVEISASAGPRVKTTVRTGTVTIAKSRPPARPMAPETPAAHVPAGSDGVSALSEHIYPFYQELVGKEVAEDLARRLTAEAAARTDLAAGPEGLRAALRDSIEKMLPAAGEIEVQKGRCRRVAFVGPAGAGKTTTIAKLAAEFALRRGLHVALVSLDLHNVANNDPIRKYADIIGVDLYTPKTVAAAKETLVAVSGCDLVLIDTPGLSSREQSRFVRLAALVRAMRPDETHLVLPASMLRSAQARAHEQYSPLTPTRLVLTRLDEIVGIGVLLNAIEPLHLGLSYTTHGQNVPNDIKSVCPRDIAQLVFS